MRAKTAGIGPHRLPYFRVAQLPVSVAASLIHVKFGMALLLIVVILVLVFVFLGRLFLVLRASSRYKPGKTRPLRVLAVAGSGGHTTEILRLLGSLSQSYSPTHYIVADSDKMSEEKICSFERSRAKQSSVFQYSIHRIPRSREVQQSWSSSVRTTLRSMLYSLPLTFRLKPDLVLCNGPGTCVPVCVSAVLLGILGIKKVIIVYVESVCRVETLSLSGWILYYFSDYFIVQWPMLKEKYPKSVYLGRIV